MGFPSKSRSQYSFRLAPKHSVRCVTFINSSDLCSVEIHADVGREAIGSRKVWIEAEAWSFIVIDVFTSIPFLIPFEFRAHLTVNDELPNRLSCGTIIVKPNIREFTESGVIFEDERRVDLDHVSVVFFENPK